LIQIQLGVEKGVHMNENRRAEYDIDRFAPTAMKFLATWSGGAQVLLAMNLLFFGGWRSNARSFDIPSARQETQLEKDVPTPLEVRVTAPPRWENGCLLVTLDRMNHSSVPVFLTKMGPYFYVALDVSRGEAKTSQAIEWVNVYGDSDIRSLEADSLAPGATVHNEFCLGPTIWVVNLKKETRREIPIRGKLRVDVSYFPTEEFWKRNKQWYIDPPAYLERDGKPNDPPGDIAPKRSRIFVAIPCSDTTCKPGCTRPPMGLPGEVRPVPDVYFITPEWNDRGRLVTDELARKFPPCSEVKSAGGAP